jgi:hypothetical protein
MMPVDDKVAFYLRHRTLIEEWAALREQAAAALEEALTRAIGLIGQHPDTPVIVDFGSDRRNPMYGISLQIPGAEVGPVWVALGWTRGHLLRPSGESWPYMGVRVPGASKGEAGYDTVKRLLRDAAGKLRWTATGGWVWYRYLPFEPGQTDFDDYAARHVEELVEAWRVLQVEFSGS